LRGKISRFGGKKKGADGGRDGIIYFKIEKNKTDKARRENDPEVFCRGLSRG
jgi:hypothetical protein